MTTPLELMKRKRAKSVNNILQKGYLAKMRVYVGMATCEIAAGSSDVMKVFADAIASGQVTDVYLSQKGCAGRCNLEPTVEVVEAGKNPVKYGKITKERAVEIINRHIKNGEVIQDWVIR
jgi:NADP-reducing hydrogenase subunit HndB